LRATRHAWRTNVKGTLNIEYPRFSCPRIPYPGPLLQQKVLQIGFPIDDGWIEIFDLLGNHRHDHFHPWGFCRIREGEQPDRQTLFFCDSSTKNTLIGLQRH
jgi:hypothetical protein